MKGSLALWIVGLVCCAVLPVYAVDVVCTTTIVGDVVHQIAGEDAQVNVLLPPDTDPHDFEPRPQDVVALHEADVIFINGLDLEAGLDPLLGSIDTPVVSLSEDIEGLLPVDDSDHSAYDPHVWFDPTLIMEWIPRIADQLSQLLPALKQTFHDRAAAYLQELSDLDAWIQASVDSIPSDRRKLVTDHRVLGYFARRYGFEQVGTVIPGYSSLAEPSARDLAALESTIEALSVPAVFVGNTVNPSLSNQVSADTDTKLVFFYTGSLSTLDGPAATYIDFMRYNTTVIVGALEDRP